MEPIVEKREALERAKKLLSQNDDDVLRYVALELRRCLEAVVYEKLWAYRNRIPPDVARKWQPPQAFRALLAIEPDADQSSIIRFAPEETPGGPVSGPFRTLGTDRRPTSAWLNKTYNKLGSMLHAHWPYANQPRLDDPQKIRDYLNKVITELQPYVAHSFTSTLASVVDFECTACGQRIIANAAGVEKNGEAFCLDGECGAHYFATKEGEQFAFRLDALPAECPDCGKEIQIPIQRITLGFSFKCKKCGSLFEVSAHTWEFQKKKSAQQTGSD